MQQVVREVSDSLRAMAQDKQLDFEIILPSEDVVTVTDHRAVHQILLNLTNNAIKYTERGSVRIELESPRYGYAAISVRDTGVGIRDEDQARLFQAFEQLDATRMRSQGVGLGLHLSRQLATLIGASISVESVYGQGSIFTLKLPVR
jgi:signal transduction histidine kinase